MHVYISILQIRWFFIFFSFFFRIYFVLVSSANACRIVCFVMGTFVDKAIQKPIFPGPGLPCTIKYFMKKVEWQRTPISKLNRLKRKSKRRWKQTNKNKHQCLYVSNMFLSISKKKTIVLITHILHKQPFKCSAFKFRTNGRIVDQECTKCATPRRAAVFSVLLVLICMCVLCRLAQLEYASWIKNKVCVFVCWVGLTAYIANDRRFLGR